MRDGFTKRNWAFCHFMNKDVEKPYPANEADTLSALKLKESIRKQAVFLLHALAEGHLCLPVRL